MKGMNESTHTRSTRSSKQDKLKKRTVLRQVVNKLSKAKAKERILKQ